MVSSGGEKEGYVKTLSTFLTTHCTFDYTELRVDGNGLKGVNDTPMSTVSHCKSRRTVWPVGLDGVSSILVKEELWWRRTSW